MDRLISLNAVLSAIGEWIAHREYDYTNATEYLRNRIKAIPSADIDTLIDGADAVGYRRGYKEAQLAIPSAYKGMTHGEVLETIFPNAECNFKKFCEEDTVVFNLNGFYMRVSADWWNSPYEPQENEDKE